MPDRYNLVVIGKTGVGKSSLINYLYERNIRKTGAGKPVNKKGFESHTFNIKNLPVCIYDSWGLGVGQSSEWTEILDAELAKRGIDQHPRQWFHTVFYCIGAGGARIEEFEIDIIKRLFEDKYIVTIVMTKADQASRAELKQLDRVIRQNFSYPVNVIPVCSERKKVIRGHKTEPFGKKDLLNQAYRDFWDSVCVRLPERCEKIILKNVDDWIAGQRKYINANIGAYNISKINEKLDYESRLYINNIGAHVVKEVVDDEIQGAIQMYKNISQAIQDYNSFMPRHKIELIFPEIDKGAQRALGAISGILFPTLLLGWWRLKSMGKSNALKVLDQFETELKKEILKITPEIQRKVDDIRTIATRDQDGNQILIHGIKSSYKRIRDFFQDL
jgi:GTP-binding protein EngB required for normal cell division